MEINVTVEEILSRVVTVDADDEEEAILIVENMYDNEYIILDETDFQMPARFFIEKEE